MNSIIKWKVPLSTTEQNNIGLIRVRQDNVNTETWEIQITENSIPKNFDLDGIDEVYFNTGFKPKISVQQRATIVDAKKGIIRYTMNNYDMQQANPFQAAYFEFRREGKFVGSTQTFFYHIMPSIYQSCTDSGTYIIRLEELFKLYEDFYNKQKQEAIDYQKDQKEMWENFVESCRNILEAIDPGGLILTELIDGRYSKMLDRHFPSLQARGDFFDDSLSSDKVHIDWYINDDEYADDALSKALSLSNIIYFSSRKYKFKNPILLDDVTHIIGAQIIRKDSKFVSGTILEFEIEDECYSSIEFNSDARMSSFKNIAVLSTEINKSLHGIAFNPVNSDDYAPYIEMENVWCDGFKNGSGFYLPQIFLSRIVGGGSQNNLDGYSILGFGTSTTIENTYAMSNLNYGYDIQDLTYSTLISLAADGNKIGYSFADCYGVSGISLGSERNSTTGFLVKSSVRGLTLDNATGINNGRDTSVDLGTFIHVESGARSINLSNPNALRDDSSVIRDKTIVISSNVSGNISNYLIQKQLINDSVHYRVNGQKSSYSIPTFAGTTNDFIANRNIASNDSLIGWICVEGTKWKNVWNTSQFYGTVNPAKGTGYIDYSVIQSYRSMLIGIDVSVKGLSTTGVVLLDSLPESIKKVKTTQSVIANNTSDTSLNGRFIITAENKLIFRSENVIPTEHTYQGAFSINLRY